MDRLSKQEIEKLRDSKYPWAQLTKMIHGLPSNSDAPDDAIRYLCDLALQSLSQEAVRDEVLEAKVADVLASLEILNFMDVGVLREGRKREYEHIRGFLISLAPGVVEPNFEKAKK